MHKKKLFERKHSFAYNFGKGGNIIYHFFSNRYPSLPLVLHIEKESFFSSFYIEKESPFFDASLYKKEQHTTKRNSQVKKEKQMRK